VKTAKGACSESPSAFRSKISDSHYACMKKFPPTSPPTQNARDGPYLQEMLKPDIKKKALEGSTSPHAGEGLDQSGMTKSSGSEAGNRSRDDSSWDGETVKIYNCLPRLDKGTVEDRGTCGVPCLTRRPAQKIGGGKHNNS